MMVILVDFDLVMHSHIMDSFLTCLRMCVTLNTSRRHMPRSSSSVCLVCLQRFTQPQMMLALSFKRNHSTVSLETKSHGHIIRVPSISLSTCAETERRTSADLLLWNELSERLCSCCMCSWCFRGDFWVTLNGTLYCRCFFRSLWDFGRWFTLSSAL